MHTRLLEPDQVSHTQSMAAKTGLANWANVHTPMLKKSFKIPIDPAILASIRHRFIAKKTN